MWIPSVFRSVRNDADEPARKSALRKSGETQRGDAGVGLLVVTADDKFYYRLLSLAIDLGWPIRRARNLHRAQADLLSTPLPIVVYDERLPRSDWREGLRVIGSSPAHPLVLLATIAVDEDVWRDVLNCHGYDAVRRSSAREEWMRMLRFAWLSLNTPEEEAHDHPTSLATRR